MTKTCTHAHATGKLGGKHDIESFIDACTTAFRERGGRVTKPRLAVIRCIATSAVPLGAREIFDKLAADPDVPNVDQVSVYRILEALSELGYIHQVFPSGSYIPCFHVDCESKLHVLIRCSCCNRIDELDVPQEALAPLLYYLAQEQQFVADEHAFQLNGTCADCRES